MAGILKLFQPSFDKYCQFSLPCFLLVLSFFLGSCDKNSNTPSNKSKAAEGIVASGNAEGADKVDSSSEKPSGPPDIGTSAQDAALPAKDSTLKTLDFIPNQAVAGERGVKLSYQLKLVNNLAALFSCLVPCPAGLSVDEKTGQIAWTPLATQEGALTANFQAKINEVLAKTEVKFTISKGLSGLFLSNLAANTVRSFAVDSLGNTYLAGFTQAKPFEAIAYQSSSAIFLTKLGKNGQKLWTRVMSGPTANNSVGMTAGNEFVILDQKEQPLVFGHTLAGLDALTTVGGFLARFDGSGTRIQTQFIPGLTTQPSLVSTHADGSFQIITQPASPGASPAFLKLTQAGATLLNVMLPGFNFARVIIGPKRENFILTTMIAPSTICDFSKLKMMAQFYGSKI